MDSQHESLAVHRVPLDYRELVGYKVFDRNGRKMGVADAIWEDQEGHPAFVGVRIGTLGLSRMRAVPLPLADIDEDRQSVGLPIDGRFLVDAPAFDGDFEFNDVAERGVYDYFKSVSALPN
jgi:hypothetical protein